MTDQLVFITGRFYHPTKAQKIVCTRVVEDSNINYVIFEDKVRQIKGKMFGCPLDSVEILRRYDKCLYDPC